MVSKLSRFLGSDAAAPALVAVLAAAFVLVALREGAGAAAFTLLHQGWLLALLGLLALHLTVRLFLRRPWGWPVAALAIASLALDLLVAGALLSVVGGVSGQMRLAEGDSSDRLALSERSVRIDGGPLLAARPGASLRLADGAVIHVLHVMPSARKQGAVRTDGTEKSPALHFRLGNDETAVAGWLMARSADLSHRTLGPLLLRFRAVAVLPSRHHGPTLYLDREGREFAVPVDQVGVVRDLPGTGSRVRILAAWHSATVRDRRVVESKRPVDNPAVEFALESKQRVERHAAFAHFPQFPTYEGDGAPPSGLQARYDLGDGSSPVLSFYRLPNGSLYACMPHASVKVEKGRPFATPWMGMKVTVDQIAEHARELIGYVPAPGGVPVAVLSSGNDYAWAALGEAARLGGHRVRFEADAIPLGFSVRVERLRVHRDPGTARPVSAAADLTIAEGGRTVNGRVASNQPFRYRGYVIQLPVPGAGSDAGTVAELQVQRDPGAALKAAGGWLLLLAALWSFYVEPYRLRSRRGAAQGEIPPLRAPRIRPQPGAAVLALALLLWPSSAAVAAPAKAPQDGRVPAGMQLPAGHPGMAGAKPAAGHAVDPWSTLPAGHASLSGRPASAAPIPSTARRGLDLAAVRRLAIQSDGCVISLDTFARELVRQVTGEERFEGRDPVDMVLTWVADGPQWSTRRLVYLPDRGLRRALGLDPEETRFSRSLLADNEKLRALAAAGRRDGARASAEERAAVAVSDRVTLLGAAFAGRILAMVPPGPDPHEAWLAPTDVAAMNPACARSFMGWLIAYRNGDAHAMANGVRDFEAAVRTGGGGAYPAPRELALEIVYQHAHLPRIAWILYAVALLALGLGARWPRTRCAAIALAGTGFLFHTGALLARTVLVHHGPLSGGYEPLVWAAWCVAAMGLVLARHGQRASVAMIATGLAAALLFAADAFPLQVDPAVRPLAPLLRGNPGLQLSVLATVAGCAALTLAVALGMGGLIESRRGAEATLGAPLGAALRLGVVLLIAGLLVAGGSPLFLWPLITVLGCLLLLQIQSLGWIAVRGLAAGSAAVLPGAVLAWQQVIQVVQMGRGGLL